MSVVRFKTVATFNNFLDSLPGTATSTLREGDICYCSDNGQLYYVGALGSYSNGAIFDLPTDVDIAVTPSKEYDTNLVYRQNGQFYTFDGSSFVKFGGQDLSISPDNQGAGSGPILLEMEGSSLKGSLRAVPTSSFTDGLKTNLNLVYGLSPGVEGIPTGAISIFVDDESASGGVYVNVPVSQSTDPYRTIHLVTENQVPPINHASTTTDYGLSSTINYGHTKSLAVSEVGDEGLLSSVPLIVGADVVAEDSFLIGTFDSIFAKADHTHKLPSLNDAFGISATKDQLNGISDNLISFTRGLLDEDEGLQEYLQPITGTEDPKKFSAYLDDIKTLQSNVIYNANALGVTGTQMIGTELSVNGTTLSATGLTSLKISEQFTDFTINEQLVVGNANVTVNGNLSVKGAAEATSASTPSLSVSNTISFANDGIKFELGQDAEKDTQVQLNLGNNSNLTLAPQALFNFGDIFYKVENSAIRLNTNLYFGTSTTYGIFDNNSIVVQNLRTNAITFDGKGALTLDTSSVSGSSPYYKLTYKIDESDTSVTLLTSKDVEVFGDSEVSGDRDDLIPTSKLVASHISKQISDLGLGSASKKNSGTASGYLPELGMDINSGHESYPAIFNSSGQLVAGDNKLGTLAYKAPIRQSSPTVSDNVYSCDYIDTNFVQRSLITKMYLLPSAIDGTVATTTLAQPSVDASKYLLLSNVTNTTLDYTSSNYLEFTLTFNSDTTVSYNDAITISLSVYSNQANRSVEYGAVVEGPAVTGSSDKVYWNQGSAFGAITLAQNVNNVKLDVDFSSLTSAQSVAAGSTITVRIYMAVVDGAGALTTRYYCGVNYNGSDRYSYVEINYNGVYLNTNQITDGAITIEKLGSDVIQQINTMSNNIANAITCPTPPTTANMVPYFNNTTGKTLLASTIAYTDIMTTTTPVYIIKSASNAISVTDRAKFLIDTSDEYILKYYNGSAWTPVVIAWA